MTRLKSVLAVLCKSNREKLARLAGTTADVLRQYASEHRYASAEKAIKIEKAAEKMGLDVPRGSLCEACRTCEYARTCLKGKK